MVETGEGKNNIFRHVEKIQLSDIHHQAHGYFGPTGIINFVNILPNTLVVSSLLNLFTSSQEVHKFYDRVHSDMISKFIEGSIKNISHKKISLD